MSLQTGQLGLVCGACDRFNPLGTPACTECGFSLSLDGSGRSLTPRPASAPQKSAVVAASEPASSTGADEPGLKTTAREPVADIVKRVAESVAPGSPQLVGEATYDGPPLAPLIAAAAYAPLAPSAHPPGVAPRPAPATATPPRPEAVGGGGLAARKLSSVYDSGGRRDAFVRAPSPVGGIPAAGTTGIRRPVAPDLPLAPPPGRSLSPVPRRSSSDPARRKPPSYAHLTQEELMDQARHYLCWQCFTPVPTGHKFCGRCGAEVPPEIMSARTMFFSDMQNPAKARVVLIRGEGMDGLSYHLKMEQHIIGRRGHIEFPEDPFVSPKHANLFYREGKLIVRDEGSLNGVFIRVRGSVDISPGDTFLAGEQAFRLDLTPKHNENPDADGTLFYGSPKAPSPFRISQILQGGAHGMTVCARTNVLQLGREGGDLNFPADVYMSGSHCRIEENNGRFTLTDLNSRNGTYVRIKSERELGHGDYLFVGRKLLRVELNALAVPGAGRRSARKRKDA
jgi:pSer/pThr/pTyr-binding forkhead associated (FHA) protein